MHQCDFVFFVERGKAAPRQRVDFLIGKLGTRNIIALCGGIMKRNIGKKIKNFNRKIALCLMIAGFSTFGFGFTHPVEDIKPVEKITVETPAMTSNVLTQTAEFVNTTREAVDKAPNEAAVEPINVIDGAANLTYENNIEDETNIEDGTIEYNQLEEGMNYTAIMSMEATAYLPSDGGGSGITAIGIPATYGVVAVDPGIIPLGSRLYIPGYGMAIAADTGGAIYGYRIDLCMESYAEAMNFGRRVVTVYVLD